MGDRLGLIVDADMHIAHRHLHVSMPGQFLRLGQSLPGPQDLRDERFLGMACAPP